MEALRKRVAEHRRIFAAVIIAFIVFINCCGFPVYNFGKELPTFITIEYLMIPILSCGYIGGGLALLYPQKRYGFVLALLLVLTGIGMGCRFLLEFGEVSNTYNFTMSNIAFHVLVMIVASSLSWLRVKTLGDR